MKTEKITHEHAEALFHYEGDKGWVTLSIDDGTDYAHHDASHYNDSVTLLAGLGNKISEDLLKEESRQKELKRIIDALEEELEASRRNTKYLSSHEQIIGEMSRAAEEGANND